MVDAKADILPIFSEALAQVTEEDRSNYLDQACGTDFELRRRLEDLLAAHAGAGQFLGGPSPCAYPNSVHLAEKPGDAVGPYKLVEQIGEGGFGIVFMAEQEQPVRRRVALKIIKPGMDTRDVITRFEAERQALAMMDHPHIAKVFDAGSTDTGRPYFAMELVKGISITDYCDQCNLSTRERLELFVLVCQAVQHAHQKGVIHRDLKPTNVLVAMQDGQLAPKIIDFGVAKAIGARLTEHTLVTAFAQMVGTPMYMSPEQAEMSPLEVDTRTDVYSLGVLLYELLTGTTPFEKDRLKEASFDELRRIIREEEPPMPSSRISTLNAAHRTTAAEHRRTEPHKLGQLVRGELDWIVMKCLEKDRSRRYETASSLATDVGRYLHDEPVEACPPSATYRVRKLIRRNKGLVLAASLVLLVLVGGVIGTTWGMMSALAERDQKVAALATAEHNLRKATQAVDEYLTLVSEDTIAQDPALEPLRDKLLLAALRYYQDFVQQESNSPALQAELVAAYLRIGYLSYTLDPEADWLTPAENAFDIMEDLLRKKPDLAALESLQRGIGRPSGAGAYFRQPIKALRIFTKGRRVWEQLVANYPGVLGFQLDLATFISATSGAYGSQGKRVEAYNTTREVCSLLQRLRDDHPNDPRASADLAMALAGLARAEAHSGNEAEAKTAALASVQLAQGLAEQYRDKWVYQEILAWVQVGPAEACEHFGQFDQAAEHYHQRARLFEELVDRFPTVSRYSQELMYTLMALGDVLWAAERYDEAVAVYEQVNSRGQQLKPDDSHGQSFYAWFMANCPHDRFRDPQIALQVADALVDRQPEIGDYWLARGVAKYRIGDLRGARQDLETGLELPNQPLCGARLILPMVYEDLGNHTRARIAYHAAFDWLKKHQLRYSEFRRLGSEAAKLVGEPLPESYQVASQTDAEPTASDEKNQTESRSKTIRD